MSLQGSLRSLSIPDLLTLLHHQKKTGLLSLVSRLDERGILFHRGNLVYATACADSRRLGHFLTILGFVSESDLGLSAAPRETPFLGRDLVARGLLTEAQLNEAVREQVLDILDEVLLWEEGAFHFDDEQDSEVSSPVPSGPVIPTQSILLEAIRRFDESNLIRKSFPDLSAVLKAEAPLPEDPPLEQKAVEIFQLVDGRRTVAEILRGSDVSPYEASLQLTSLAAKGLVQSVSRTTVKFPSIPEPWSLPVAPDLPGRIYWIFRQNWKQLNQLAKAIGREPSLAAKALRQFTAARLTPPSGEHSVAVMVEGLGDLRVRALVIPEVIRGVFFAERDFFWKDCREHSLLCAHLCRDLARRLKYPQPEEAYLAGLLHNLGVFVMVGVYPERYRAVLDEVRRSRRDLQVVEEAAFGMSHVQVGALCAERWGFPPTIARAIELHHQGSEEEADPITDIVAVANWVAGTNGIGVEFSSRSGQQVEGAMKRLKLKRKSVLEISEAALAIH